MKVDSLSYNICRISVQLIEVSPKSPKPVNFPKHCFVVRRSWKLPPHLLPICKPALQSSATLFDLAKKAKRIDALESESGNPEFWNDPAKAQRTMQELA